MPDAIGLLKSLAAAALTAAAVALLFERLLQRWPRLVGTGLVLGVGLGFAAGCVALGLKPNFPPREDQDRLLLILMPAVLLIELSAPGLGRWAWLLRCGLVASAGYILLLGTVYLEDLIGPGSREWPPITAALILGALGAGLLAMWAALAGLAQRTGDRTIPLAVAVSCGGAALSVMLSGYASGGQIGVPLAAAVCGGLLATFLLARPLDVCGMTGFAVVGLFGLLLIGRFFGDLASGHALVLFLAPLACWLSELLPVAWMRPAFRSFTRVVLATVPILLIVAAAHQKFAAAIAPAAQSGSQEGSLDDYLNYGQ